MDRLQKKCLIASGGMHLFLMVLLLVGSAFVPRPKSAPPSTMIRVVSPRTVEDTVAGGGGAIILQMDNAKQNGETTNPRPTPPASSPAPKATKKSEPQKTVEKPKEPLTTSKTSVKEPRKLDNDILKHLKPATQTVEEIARNQAGAEAQDRVNQEHRVAATENAYRQNMAEVISRIGTDLRAGFKGGTKVMVGGPGGEAYAGYDLWVKEKYDNAWAMPLDLVDEDATTTVSVTIARTGEVLVARIVRRSSNSVLDKSVRRALDSVTFVRPFPEGATDNERTFTINFNLKAKKTAGKCRDRSSIDTAIT